jgi:hypothetical protein
VLLLLGKIPSKCSLWCVFFFWKKLLVAAPELLDTGVESRKVRRKKNAASTGTEGDRNHGKKSDADGDAAPCSAIFGCGGDRDGDVPACFFGIFSFTQKPDPTPSKIRSRLACEARRRTGASPFLPFGSGEQRRKQPRPRLDRFQIPNFYTLSPSHQF